MKANLFLPILFFVIFGNSNLFAQSLSRSVIGGAGDYYESAAGGDLHFTLGELAIEYLNEEESLAQGFHRLHLPLLDVAVDNPNETAFDFTLYPNPTADYVTVQTDNQDKMTLTVTDILGRSLRQISLNSGRHTLDVSELPAGTYAFSVYNNSHLLYSEKVQIIR